MEQSAVRHCRIVGLALNDGQPAQPVEIDLLLDAAGAWSADIAWPGSRAAAVHLHSDQPIGRAIIGRFLAPTERAPQPAD